MPEALLLRPEPVSMQGYLYATVGMACLTCLPSLLYLPRLQEVATEVARHQCSVHSLMKVNKE